MWTYFDVKATVFLTHVGIQQIDMIANVKSEIIVSCWHFFADVIFSATLKVQNYQNKTGEKDLYSSKYVLTTYFGEF